MIVIHRLRFLAVMILGFAVLIGSVGCTPPGDDTEMVPENTADRCSDGIDNDLDGHADGDDGDCVDFGFCS